MEMPEVQRTAPEGTAEPVGVASAEATRRVRIPVYLRCLVCGRALFHRESRLRPCFFCDQARAQLRPVDRGPVRGLRGMSGSGA